MAIRGASGRCTTQSFCFWNRVSIIGKYLSLPPQRASMKPAAASWSSGNSRKMKRTLPVSMYLRLELRIDHFVEVRAMRARHRRIFDDGDRCLVVAKHHVSERARLHQFGGRHGLRRCRMLAVQQSKAGDDAGERASADGKFATGNVHRGLRGVMGSSCRIIASRAFGPVGEWPVMTALCNKQCGKDGPVCQGPNQAHPALTTA